MIGITVLAFIAGAALIFGVNLLYADVQRARLQKVQEQLQREQQLVQRERAQIAVAHRDLYESAALSGANLSQRKTFQERLGLFFEQSGVRLQPLHVAMIMLPAVAAGAGGAWLL